MTETPTQATTLVNLALDEYELGVATSGETFGVPTNGPRVARMLRGGPKSLRAELAAAYLDRNHKTAGSGALADALLVLEGQAQATSPVELALRTVHDGGRIVVDLGTVAGWCVEIDRMGWKIRERSPVLFHRTRLTAPLPEPERDGNLDELREHINIADDDWPLLVAWLIATLFDDRPCPALQLLGEQGSGKTDTGRRIVAVVDPSRAALRDRPADPAEWAVTVAASRCVGLDNLSGITPWLSDAICRAVTKDAFTRRRLYTDDDLVVVQVRRAILWTTIDVGAVKGDLAERLLTIELPRIGGGQRRSDEDLDRTFNEAHARIVGGLYTLTSQVLARLGSIHLDTLPRMADFARIVAAVDEILGTNALDAYLDRAIDSAESLVDSDPLARAIRDLVHARTQWVGTPGALLGQLAVPDPRPKNWPADATRLGGQLRRVAPTLREIGITLDIEKRNGQRHVRLELSDPASDPETPPSDPAATLLDNANGAGQDISRDARDARDAENPRTNSLSENKEEEEEGQNSVHSVPASLPHQSEIY